MALENKDAKPMPKPSETDVPGDDRTLTDVLDETAQKGFGSHAVGREGEIECGNCGELVNPAGVHVSLVDRLEGASDVADEMLVIAFECPRCGTGNSLTLGYGPNASESDQMILKSIDLGPASERRTTP